MDLMPISMPKDIDKYFFNRVKDIEMITTQLSMLEKDIPPQLLITGYRGVGKTFLLRKILNDLPSQYLSVFIDLSEITGRKKGKITEEEVLKIILNRIYGILDEKNMRKLKDKILSNFKKLLLKNYDFSNDVNFLDIPIPVIFDNYKELGKFVMELPQNIVDSSECLNKKTFRRGTV